MTRVADARLPEPRLRRLETKMSRLFEPLDIGPVRAPNRIAISPMCQYSAHDGCASDWHLQHLPMLAMSGAGLVMVEMTDVERHGRITHGCMGLYNDDNERALSRALSAAKAVALPGTCFGIQIALSGRKGSAQKPWDGGHALGSEEEPWPTVAPSPIRFDEGWPTPGELDAKRIARGVTLSGFCGLEWVKTKKAQSVVA
jgi:2,4-dienoyl-CoA reductase-like NADH-dependent reductase (Old Yellow Enzyme family)